MSKEELVQEITELYHQIHRAVRQDLAEDWMELDITIPQLKTLGFIHNQGTTNTKQIAEELGVTKSNMTGIIDRLVKRKLVSRRENPADRRMHELRLTKEGENTITGLRERFASSTYKAMSLMREEDLATLAEGLSILVKAAEASRKKA
jgi:DNA-binding MarR family transcriptional regulator